MIRLPPITRLTFRLKGSRFTADVFVYPGLVSADETARSTVRLACVKLGGVSPRQLELIA